MVSTTTTATTAGRPHHSSGAVSDVGEYSLIVYRCSCRGFFGSITDFKMHAFASSSSLWILQIRATVVCAEIFTTLLLSVVFGYNIWRLLSFFPAMLLSRRNNACCCGPAASETDKTIVSCHHCWFNRAALAYSWSWSKSTKRTWRCGATIRTG